MFRPRITLEKYLKFVEHEAAAGGDTLLDDINIAPDLEEEDDVEINEEEELNSNVWKNINLAHISIPEDFKDDHEVLIIGKKVLGVAATLFALLLLALRFICSSMIC